MPEAISAPRAPARAEYQAAAERLAATRSAELGGWTIVRDAYAHYWRAYRETPCSIVVSSASAVDLSVALVTHDAGSAVEAERDRFREALEFYADVDTWDGAGIAREVQLDGSLERDFGGVARAALGVSDDR